MFGRTTDSCADTPHRYDVLRTRDELFPWDVDDAVVKSMATVDLNKIRSVLENHRTAEPKWDDQRDARFLNDSRVAHLAAGGYVFENLSVYMTMTNLLSPALLLRREPVVLDVGCGTGFLTMVLADLVKPRGGRVIAIDLFERQVEHAARDTTAVRPDLAPSCEFRCANAFEFDAGELRFDAIAVAAQCSEVPQNLVRLLKPGGLLVCPLGRIVPIDSDDPDRFQPFCVVEGGAVVGGPPAKQERAGPISVNFLPLIPPR